MNDADPVFHVQPPHIAHTQVITVRHRHTNLGGRRAGAQLEPAKVILQLVLTFERFRGRDLGELQQPAPFGFELRQTSRERLGNGRFLKVRGPFYC